MKVDDKKAAATLEELGLRYNDIDKVAKKGCLLWEEGEAMGALPSVEEACPKKRWCWARILSWIIKSQRLS